MCLCTAQSVMSGSLHLNIGRVRPKYKLHPLVVFSILDHYKRRNEDQKRVVGTLLGEKVGHSFVIKNCFPIPHTEKEDQVRKCGAVICAALRDFGDHALLTHESPTLHEMGREMNE